VPLSVHRVLTAGRDPVSVHARVDRFGDLDRLPVDAVDRVGVEFFEFHRVLQDVVEDRALARNGGPSGGLALELEGDRVQAGAGGP
jgi:hypothetical protein